MRSLSTGVLCLACLSLFFSASSVEARFAMAGEDNICAPLPTPGDPYGSDCRCIGIQQEATPSGSCKRGIYFGESLCTGYEVGTPCNGGGVDPIEPEFKVEIQDSVFVNLLPIEGNDTLTARDFSAAYEFHNLYDSCRVIYTFSELWQEETRLELLNWDYEHFEKNKNAAQLSALSRSKSFVVTGDTISYFRSVQWFDPRSGKRQQLVDNFYCTDSLTYIVSMVNELTSARIEVERLLVVSDGSGHIMTSGGLPIAVRKWVPPTGWNGKNAYVDIEITVEGSGLFDPARKDDIVGRLSRALEEPFYSTYYSQFNVSYEVEEEIE